MLPPYEETYMQCNEVTQNGGTPEGDNTVGKILFLTPLRRCFLLYNLDVDYFKNIDTEDKAYWLGFLYADGCVTQDKKSLHINLAPVDIEHLKKFIKCIQSNHVVKYRDNNRYVSLIICNKQFINNLVDKGCVPAKSLILRFPSKDIVPDYLIRHFIRGYFDGDGCYSAIMRKCANKPNPIFMGEIKFLGTYDMMEHISQELPCDNVDVSKDGAIYKIRYHKKELLKAILSYMYDDSVIYLDRKYQKYLDNKDNLIDKRKVKNNIPVTTTVV